MQQYKEKNAVAILTFNRSETTKKLMEIMKIIKPPRLYVIIDGPRDSHKGEKEKVDIVKQIIDDNVDWECELYKNYSEKNMGTCMRQYTGFSWVFEKEEQAIILEDDCIPNLDFFRYCDEMLEKYKDDERVMMVSGSNYLKKWESGYSYHFSSMGGIWGWATWRRAWLKYDVDIRAWGDYELKKELREKLGWEMYQHRREAWDSLYVNSSKAKTWDFQWWFARTINSGLTIIPSVNLVSNVGFDSGAVHTTASSPNVNLEVYDLKFPLKHPNYVMENTGYDRALFNSLFRGRFRKRLHRKVNDLLEWKGKV